MDALFQRFYAETVGPYWPPERALIDDAYRAGISRLRKSSRRLLRSKSSGPWRG